MTSVLAESSNLPPLWSAADITLELLRKRPSIFPIVELDDADTMRGDDEVDDTGEEEDDDVAYTYNQ